MPTDVNIILTLFLMILGAAILITGGETFVRGATRIAAILRIPTLIVGLTIVSAATSAPELSVSLTGVLGKTPNPDIAVGNVVGSNIANILLILGISAFVRPLAVSSGLTKREIPMMIVFSFLLWGIGLFSVRPGNGAGSLHRFPFGAALLFVALLIGYNVFIVKEAQRRRNREIAGQIAEQTQTREKLPGGFTGLFVAFLFLAAGLVMLVFGSNLFVTEAKIVAAYCGVSELVISLTILAVGTSLPELVVGLVAVARGNVDIAVGNVVGSNIFNLLGILGITAAAAGGLVISNQALVYDIPIMCATSLLGGYFCITDKNLSRWEGAVLLLGYAGYLFFLANRG
ncbi:MAG: calcium/sodium antiporter [Thermoguttaceae bacterium]|nr:calcium/sodium antiporter [Thermoguttaceae bacterium]